MGQYNCSKLKAKVEQELLEHEDMKSEIKTEGNQHSYVQNERAALIVEKDYLQDQLDNKLGSYEREFNEYIEQKMKIAKSKHFAGDALVGNLEDRFHKEVLSGNFGFLDCLLDRPAIRRKYVRIWKILSVARKAISTKHAKKEQIEDAATKCEKFTAAFPILFPQNNITRKMHALSIVLPRQIRKDGIFYKMLKIEQMGESLHQKLNTLETRYANVWPKSKRYFMMLEELENSYYIK